MNKKIGKERHELQQKNIKKKKVQLKYCLIAIVILGTALAILVHTELNNRDTVSANHVVQKSSEPEVTLTIEPTTQSTIKPTTQPTIEPTAEPTIEPTAEPTTEPTPQSTLNPVTMQIPSTAKKLTNKTIFIDPGHGGGDPGTMSGEYKETTINLQIALTVKKLLEERGYKVIMTRTTDTDVYIKSRPKIINESGAGLFISIHQNAALEGDTVSSGMETWYNNQNNSLNKMVVNNIHQSIIDNTSARDRGARVKNDYYILKETKIPGCLIECGFLSSTNESAKLITNEYQDKIAQGIVSGIEKCYE